MIKTLLNTRDTEKKNQYKNQQVYNLQTGKAKLSLLFTKASAINTKKQLTNSKLALDLRAPGIMNTNNSF